MERKNRKIETFLDSQNNYASAGLEIFNVSYSWHGEIGSDLLKILKRL